MKNKSSRIKPWLWFVGIYAASVIVVATVELGAHWFIGY